MSSTNEDIRFVTEAHDAVDKSERLSLAASQLAISLAGGMQSYLGVSERLEQIETSEFNLEELLTDGEKAYLPAAKVIVGLIFEEADEHAHRKTYRMGQNVRRQLR